MGSCCPRILYKLISGDEASPNLVSIRSVRSVDALKANIFEIPLEKLRQIGKRVIEMGDVGAVFYDISPKPPATIEYE